ncbi:MAG: VCBS repeat-containing protein [Chitinophagaceae bacterium]|nr:VCBS repeat-containing protein [Chitinophagaceae bacterium]MCA6453987.1 VCBS repeat-containing protein [Chitinophagaceae bacterium]MCA6454575.1 VCBS repeat-containing protein [Chitinophagaceae bacterium]MCA6459380.1 VCBS repeat-containing protein [Chitinophagaceae bacterium]MCA6464816.1 VCBS repeat-containing protein [Chitinophagaceae bacterium]
MKYPVKYFPFFLFCFFSFLLISCKRNQPLFTKIDADRSGIHFNNRIQENDSVNVLDFENVYNGGGVGVGDFNKDGLPDLYFSGNLVQNKLYLNKGDFVFEDVTDKAGVNGDGKWCRGVSVVDINNDGLMDVYVSATLLKDPKLREHLLYVNQGNDKEGIPHFKNLAAEYGLADTTHGTMAAFFDYDNDGDLDVYMVNNEIVKNDYPNRFRPILKDGSHKNTDKLFRNDWDSTLKHPVYKDVSREAGILVEGYGHAVTIADFNKDGWKDMYVSNDYLSNDLLWINNRNGTFSEQLNTYFKHTAANAMGNDVVDINNDGLSDVITLDMNPEDNYRKKMMMNANSYQTYQNSDYFGYQYQYVRNMLQLNQGPRVGQNDSVGDPIFSDVSFYAGIAETDWSWTPMVADFDNDGNRDIIITNGFPKDVTDHDFVAFRNTAYAVATKKQLLAQIPEVKIHNYAFRNNGDLHFTNVTQDWGLNLPSFSNGGVYADLDNDGDLDMVVNNINDEAGLYRNNAQEQVKDKKESNHFLQIQLHGDSLNKGGLGTWLELYYDNGKKQFLEHTPYRGYLSSVDVNIHFGLGKATLIDSLIVRWPNGKMQRLRNVKADQRLSVDYQDAQETYQFTRGSFVTGALFTDVTTAVNIRYIHPEKDFVDFNIQKLIPHKFSEYGPALAVGDVDGNGLDDMVTGGSFSYSGQLFLQQQDGKFVQKALLPGADINTKRWEEEGMLLFDADGDGDLDLYVASGGYENERNTLVYQDKLYVNDGKGNYTIDMKALPTNMTSKMCVKAIDYDHDGDLDIFVSGRVDPWNYPKPVSSFIYRNDSRPGLVRFTDVTSQVAKPLENIGLVCDALFTDFDNDGWSDLILAGEWMPVTFLKNNKGVFSNVTDRSGVQKQTGWWNTIAPGDFDNDGDIDYIIGNMGRNSFYRASEKYPVHITAADFDKNGSYDAFPSLFLPDKKGEMKEFPAQTRDDIVKQMISMRTRFQNYKTYAEATMDKLFPAEQFKQAQRVEANTFQSVYLRNDGNGTFTMSELPQQAQFSALNGISVADFDGDGNLDVAINGNDYGTEVSVGRYDALNGLVLKGDGKGNFKALSILQSGIFLPGNGKALVQLRGKDGTALIAASENRGPLRVFKQKQSVKLIPVTPADISATIFLKDGRKQKQELYYGASFLSQSGRFLQVPLNAGGLDIRDIKGNIRRIQLN